MRLALLLAGLAVASPAFSCDGDWCSNDRDGVLGDEELLWDAVTEWGLDPEGNPAGPGQYEVWREGDVQACDLVPATQTRLDVARSNCMIPTGSHRLYVRACNSAGICGQFGGPVHFLTYACARHTTCDFTDDNDARNDGCSSCEFSCFPAAPRRMPWLSACP